MNRLRAVSSCRGPPTSPSTVTGNTRDDRRAVDNDTYSAFVAFASGVFALAEAGAAAGAGAPTGANNDDRRRVDRRFRRVDLRLLLG